MNIFLQSLYATLEQLLFWFAIPAIFAVLLYLLEKQTSRLMVQAVGWKGVMVTAWIGTPIHECGHAIMCLIFRHKIVELKLYSPDQSTGTLGYVKHSFSKRNVYQQVGRFFIGMAPLIFGSLFLFVVFKLYAHFTQVSIESLLPKGQVQIGVSILENLKFLMDTMIHVVPQYFSLEHLQNPWYYAFLYLILCVAAHMAPSHADIKGGLPGLFIFIFLLYLLNLALISFTDSVQDVLDFGFKMSSSLAFMLSCALILSVIHFGLVFIFRLIVGTLLRK